MTAIPRLTVKDDGEFRSSPCRQVFKHKADKKKVGEMHLVNVLAFILSDIKISLEGESDYKKTCTYHLLHHISCIHEHTV